MRLDVDQHQRRGAPSRASIDLPKVANYYVFYSGNNCSVTEREKTHFRNSTRSTPPVVVNFRHPLLLLPSANPPPPLPPPHPLRCYSPCILDMTASATGTVPLIASSAPATAPCALSRELSVINLKLY
ncbi:hypothetical protein J6590_023157 [Homalodisca vitripennis]|nr:hypothetical protein J6590_023157 [Homalodisca vitripennis]